MRIVSLSPAATEWVALCGWANQLVGRSHVCVFPETVAEVPVLTVAGDEAGQGRGAMEVDAELLRELEPDLILLDDDDDVGIGPAEVEQAVEGWSGASPDLFVLRPTTVREVLTEGLRLGRALGRVEAVMAWMGEAETELRRLRDQLGLHKQSDESTFPTVACLTSSDPPRVGGRWIPGICEMAGGRAVLAEEGAPPHSVGWGELREADPDFLAVMPTRSSRKEAERDVAALAGRAGWRELRAVRDERVVFFDGRAYFNRPGPRIYRAIELLARALHPGQVAVGTNEVEPWEMRTLF